jgi:ABC-type molybdate transport system permease subunit
MAGGSLLATLHRLSLIGSWGGDMQALGVLFDQWVQIAIVVLSLPLGYLYAKLRYGTRGRRGPR